MATRSSFGTRSSTKKAASRTAGNKENHDPQEGVAGTVSWSVIIRDDQQIQMTTSFIYTVKTQYNFYRTKQGSFGLNQWKDVKSSSETHHLQ